MFYLWCLIAFSILGGTDSLKVTLLALVALVIPFRLSFAVPSRLIAVAFFQSFLPAAELNPLFNTEWKDATESFLLPHLGLYIRNITFKS